MIVGLVTVSKTRVGLSISMRPSQPSPADGYLAVRLVELGRGLTADRVCGFITLPQSIRISAKSQHRESASIWTLNEQFRRPVAHAGLTVYRCSLQCPKWYINGDDTRRTNGRLLNIRVRFYLRFVLEDATFPLSTAVYRVSYRLPWMTPVCPHNVGTRMGKRYH